MKFKLKIGGKEYEVEILKEEGEVKIKVNEKEFIFGEEEKRRISFIKTSFPKRNFSKKEIRAPIAGIISEIFVKEGEFIKGGRKILSLSAMKMENEIISDFEGKVEKILIKKEQKVKEGDILIVLK